MRAPAFWWQARPSLAARLLAPLGALYGRLTARRMARAGAVPPVPVICVGNFVAGGAGKTPTALAVARLLEGLGRRPFILTRGYGGRLVGPVLIDPARHGAVAVGDEALMMAEERSVVVAHDRPAGAAFAAANGADVIIMDDGLQNPSLAKTLSIAVVDAASGIGNGLCLPAGPLRAPLEFQLGHVAAMLLIGDGDAGERVAPEAGTRGLPVLRGRLVPEPAMAARLDGARVLALAGIGRPAKFHATLASAGARIVAHRDYPDHHAYGRGDVAAILRQARQADAFVATTRKDWVKLAPLWPTDERERVLAVAVTLEFEDPAAAAALLSRALA